MPRRGATPGLTLAAVGAGTDGRAISIDSIHHFDVLRREVTHGLGGPSDPITLALLLQNGLHEED